jgi:hypothetical protein
MTATSAIDYSINLAEGVQAQAEWRNQFAQNHNNPEWGDEMMNRFFDPLILKPRIRKWCHLLVVDLRRFVKKIQCRLKIVALPGNLL